MLSFWGTIVIVTIAAVVIAVVIVVGFCVARKLYRWLNGD